MELQEQTLATRKGMSSHKESYCQEKTPTRKVQAQIQNHSEHQKLKAHYFNLERVHQCTVHKG